MKFIYRLLIVLFVLSNTPGFSQEDMFRKDRKRTWRKWRKNKQSYNPYLEKKAKNKPSAQLAKSNRREIKRQNKVAKKQMRRSRKKVNK
jgi:hypothetical protein